MFGGVRAQLLATVSRLTGCKIDDVNDPTEKRQRLSEHYIPVQSLMNQHPIIITTLGGERIIFLALEDWKAMENKEISANEYVATSIWHYGYYWGDGSQYEGGVHWQTLEGGKPGINDKEKVEMYLTSMRCRAHIRNSGGTIQALTCAACELKKCPISVIAEKKAELEVFDGENRARARLFETLEIHLNKLLGVEICNLKLTSTLDSVAERIYLSKGFIPKTVEVMVATTLYMDMMYFPENAEIEASVSNYKFFAVKLPDGLVENLDLLGDENSFLEITNQVSLKELQAFWEKE